MSLRARALEVELEDAPEGVRTRAQIFRLLIGLGGRLKTLMDRQLEPTGITTQQAACLTIASAAEQPLAQGELARALGVSHQNVRQLASSLERKGLLEIVTDPDDRRTKRLRTTRAAKRLFARRNAADLAAVAEWFRVLDDDETKVLFDLLVRVTRGLPDRARPGGAS